MAPQPRLCDGCDKPECWSERP